MKVTDEMVRRALRARVEGGNGRVWVEDAIFPPGTAGFADCNGHRPTKETVMRAALEASLAGVEASEELLPPADWVRR